MIGVRGPWIFGVIVLTMLVFLHWLACERRRASKRARRPGAAGAFMDGGGYRISDDPITPK
jgi:hypothetical protein